MLIVQPNIDPYFDKFNKEYKQQLVDFIALAKANIKKANSVVIGSRNSSTRTNLGKQN